MANVNSPCGLIPLLRGAGGNFIRAPRYSKPSSYATQIRQFDVVAQVADGSIDRTITPGTTNILGVALNGGAASTATSHDVITEPDATFIAMANGSGLAVTDRFANANIVLGTTNVFPLFSDDMVNSSTVASTATLDLKILDLHSRPDLTSGQYSLVEVRINKAVMAPGTAGI